MTPHWLHLTVLSLLLAAALRLPGLDAQSVWFDEGWSAVAAAQPSVWAAARLDDTNPPFYYSLLHLTAVVLGHHIFTLRWLSFIFGLLTTALTARLVAPGARPAVVLVGALSLPLLWASHEMRMYTLLAAQVTLLVIAWERLRTRPTRWAWAVLLLAELAILYTHNTGPVVAIWLNGVTLLAWLFCCKPPPLRWLGGQVLVLVLWLPYLLTQFVTVAGANRALVRRSAVDGRVWAALWLAPWEALTAQPEWVWATVPLLAVIVVLTPWQQARLRWLVLHLAVLTGGLLAALALLGNELHGRYLVMAVPLAVALAGAAVGRFGGRPILAGLLLVPFVGVFIAGRGLLHAYPHDDARGMVAHYANTLTASDTVLAWSYADRYELAYYWEQLGVAAKRVTLPEGADFEQIAPLLPASGDVALNVWYTQRADYRGMMHCALSHGTTTPPDTFTVDGMTSYTYRSPSLALPATQPADAMFSVAALMAAAGTPTDFTANQAVCLPVTVTLAQPLTEELKAAVIALNPLGEEIARADAIFATANQRTSRDNTLGAALTAFPVLRLPDGAPPVAYGLVLRLYDTGNLSGYDVRVGDAPAGKDWPLGTWTPQPGADWRETTPDALQLVEGPGEVVQTVRNGERVGVALVWAVPPGATLPALTLNADDGSWRVRVAPTTAQHDDLVLDWRRFRVPLAAGAGTAALTVPDGTVIARYRVEPLPLVTVVPVTDYPANAAFPGIGAVVGYNLTVTDAALAVDLVWRAASDAPPEKDYTVFVQLLDASGQLMAQSDAPPAAGERPTTGWRAGEVITDGHTLPLPPGVRVSDGTLIVGMYDEGGVRVQTHQNADYETLRTAIKMP